VAKICSVMVSLVLYCGCSTPVKPPAIDASEFLRSLGSVQAENAGYSQSILKKNDEILGAIHSLESTVKEVIQSVPPIAAQPNGQAQPIPPAAKAAQLFITSSDQMPEPFPCAPCEKLKRDIDARLLDEFEIVWSPPFEGMRGVPAIRFQAQGSPTGYKALYGYDGSTLDQIRAEMAGTTGGEPLTGTIFPVPRSSAVLSSGPALRSVSRWIGFGRRSRASTRSSCTSGRCP
jgi:hypothetical protein